jgi:hypothetical protein
VHWVWCEWMDRKRVLLIRAINRRLSTHILASALLGCSFGTSAPLLTSALAVQWAHSDLKIGTYMKGLRKMSTVA